VLRENKKEQKKKKIRSFGPLANYADRATPLVGEVAPTFADRGCREVGATDPPVVSLGFLDRSRYYFFQVAPQLSSQGDTIREGILCGAGVQYLLTGLEEK
jgi:hypothetical protein